MSERSRSQHPRFARLWERISAESDRRGTAAHRAPTLTALNGRVIEVGAGNGRNFAQYPPTVTGGRGRRARPPATGHGLYGPPHTPRYRYG